MNSPSDSIFHPCVQRQRGSTEIIIYSPEIKSIVEIAYPTMPCGQPIIASGIREWLRRRGLLWLCFCSLKANGNAALSTRIVDAVESGDTLAFCHYSPSRCGLSVNLTVARDTAYLRSHYPGLLVSGRDLAPNFKALVNNFKNRTVIFGNGDDLIAPYFEGYCGTHTSQYPGQHLKQLAGPLLYHSPSMVTGTARKAAGSYSTGKGKRRASVSFEDKPDYKLTFRYSSGLSLNINDYSPPSSPTPASTTAGPSRSTNMQTKRLLQHLANGNGLTKYEWEGLVEKCDGCHMYFEAASLRQHIKLLCRRGLE
ncbi:hypothetical protein FIBSPDRAFT_963990 [Athelia psychrophila]|uniref:Uncharacterized protein n=1 Tax=Athelia psychrophila TaxID=1759441 RepID=A0A165YAS9_9AGAM|nr:hypothetical protein FIBSPDRAFT_963990 [Fibularhizoctonia sp. CBS 109695]